MLTMVDPIDGVKFDFMAPLSQRFQLGGSWVFSNTKTSKFELSAALSSLGNPMMQDEMSFVHTRSDSTGKLELSGSLNLGNNISLKTEGFFMDSDLAKSHVQFELVKEFADSHVSYKFGGQSHSISMMQALSSKLLGGFEMIYIVSSKNCLLMLFVAPSQGSALLLWCQLQLRYPLLLRHVRAHAEKGTNLSRLCRQTKSQTDYVHRIEGLC